MSSSKSTHLFLLIQSLTKAEKRAFKLYASRSSSSQKLFIKLFDLIDSMSELNDDMVKKKLKLDSGQYSNLKRHLYSQILNSLRMLNIEKKPNIKVREYIDMAYVLYGKGLYMQALNILSQARQLCVKYGTDLSLITIMEIEKNIHSRHITRVNKEDFDQLLMDTSKLSESISHRVLLTNLKLTMHKRYVEDGHVKSAEELAELKDYFISAISPIDYNSLGIMEKIYYNQCYVWYNYVIDDYKSCLKYAENWLKVFRENEALKRRDYNLYLRGYHYALTSAYNLSNYKIHNNYLKELEKFRKDSYSRFNKNNKIFSFLYTHTGRLNNAFLSKDYEEGLRYIPKTLRRLKRYHNELDHHKIMVLHYKIAWMYICSEKPKEALPFLEGIITQRRKSLREDIQSYIRIMHLMALLDLEDFSGVLNLLNKYKYYFQQAKETNQLQIETLSYFREICKAPIFERKKINKQFLQKLLKIRKNKFEKRAFLYLDIVSWMENKIK